MSVVPVVFVIGLVPVVFVVPVVPVVSVVFGVCSGALLAFAMFSAMLVLLERSCANQVPKVLTVLFTWITAPSISTMSGVSFLPVVRISHFCKLSWSPFNLVKPISGPSIFVGCWSLFQCQLHVRKTK